jgi:lysophospholipase L1-like esterase
MKITSFTPLAVVLGLISLAAAKDASKSLALSPAPHPGKEAPHESFNEISRQGEAQLVFLGDSITAGWSKRGQEAWVQYWAPLKAANFGIGGDRTEHILWRLQNGNYDGLKPKLTVLMIGTNNTGHEGRVMEEHGGAIYSSSVEETVEGIATIVELLKEKQPQMKILLLAIFPRGADSDDPKRQQNEEINQRIAKLADDKMVTYLDINEAFLKEDGTLSREVMPDLLHPNAAGYEIWSKAIEDEVKELMAD